MYSNSQVIIEQVSTLSTQCNAEVNMLKKASIIPAYRSLQNCNICTASYSCPTYQSSTSSSNGTRPHRRPLQRSRRCSYATQRGYAAPDFRDNMNWPSRKSPATIPTPYEIFGLEPRATYSKQKYYELVKLYHPDKHNHRNDYDGITHVERLERYRLVVQAHEILSDPEKRKAYDACGAGWAESRTATRHTRGYRSPTSGKEYGYGPDHDSSVFGNATWEDWERYYRERGQEKQAYAGTYINPNAFASFVILMAVLTGIMQATRAGQYSASLGEKAQAFTEEIQQSMSARAQQLSDKNRNSDDRVKYFLERRDPSRYGLKDEEEATYRKHFANENVLPSRQATKAENG